MISWFARLNQKRRAAKVERDAARRSRRRKTPPRTKHRSGLPPDRSGGFDGNQDFVTRYGDPFDG